MKDQAVRRPVGGDRDAVAPRRLRQLSRGEALRLLRSVSLGRIVFTQQALPAIRPVNHVMDGEDIVVRLHDSATLASIAAPEGTPGIVVAYEADVIDQDTHLGWSVVVTGYAGLVRDPAELRRYETMLRPWVTQMSMNHALRIRPDLVTGFQLVAADPQAPSAASATE
ncbi:pyridoxamine 5'-phosphate oxidase family protein [Streptomyces sp. TRM49041]|uniref:pyridoxamine 5'-phosphate oxidase family protein n=1 Tax=Streptomyces sp. TRM49041 TaxID=2603216 RepID=UPI0011ECF160|nr:pyridoxamine 5'-phosphate oxidase family protein [Streptomyces sp. TRM49041]